MPSRSSRNDTGFAQRRQPNKGAEDANPRPFWRAKTLDEMTPDEWESLCDRCGRCCLVKLEDEDSGEIHDTDIGCKLFDAGACACRSYERRQETVDDCIKLTPQEVRSLRWLPRTCAYRLVSEGKPLLPWHPLLSGSPESVHAAGVSARGRTRGSETTVELCDYVDHIVDWDD